MNLRNNETMQIVERMLTVCRLSGNKNLVTKLKLTFYFSHPSQTEAAAKYTIRHCLNSTSLYVQSGVLLGQSDIKEAKRYTFENLFLMLAYFMKLI